MGTTILIIAAGLLVFGRRSSSSSSAGQTASGAYTGAAQGASLPGVQTGGEPVFAEIDTVVEKDDVGDPVRQRPHIEIGTPGGRPRRIRSPELDDWGVL